MRASCAGVAMYPCHEGQVYRKSLDQEYTDQQTKGVIVFFLFDCTLLIKTIIYFEISLHHSCHD